MEADEDTRLVDVFDYVAKGEYLRVVPVTRLSSMKGILSVPKKACSALATAAL